MTSAHRLRNNRRSYTYEPHTVSDERPACPQCGQPVTVAYGAIKRHKVYGPRSRWAWCYGKDTR